MISEQGIVNASMLIGDDQHANVLLLEEMPNVHSFDSCQINLYPKVHMSPHFHVLASDAREWLVRIDNGEGLEGCVTWGRAGLLHGDGAPLLSDDYPCTTRHYSDHFRLMSFGEFNWALSCPGFLGHTN